MAGSGMSCRIATVVMKARQELSNRDTRFGEAVFLRKAKLARIEPGRFLEVSAKVGALFEAQ